MIVFTPNTVIKSTEVNSNFTEVCPIGSVKIYAGTTEPSGWLFCYGQAISRTIYTGLFGVLNTTYGTGDGSTTFNLPDMRGRVVAGQDDMGGTSANRLTGASGGVDGDVLGGTGGAETHTLTTAELASHNHSMPKRPKWFNADGGSNTGAIYSQQSTTWQAFDWNTNNTGGDTAHNNVQPTIILNYIIKT